MTEFIYLHGFASGPNSNKANAFKKRFEELKVPICVPDLQENDFENLTFFTLKGHRRSTGSQISIWIADMDSWHNFRHFGTHIDFFEI